MSFTVLRVVNGLVTAYLLILGVALIILGEDGGIKFIGFTIVFVGSAWFATSSLLRRGN
jgi:hypothetical protein